MQNRQLGTAGVFETNSARFAQRCVNLKAGRRKICLEPVQERANRAIGRRLGAKKEALIDDRRTTRAFYCVF